MTYFQFFQTKRWPDGHAAPVGPHLLPYKAQRAISLIIHELQCQIDAKFFTFFSFLLTFGGWQGNQFGHNFMENNSIENFEA